MKVLLMILLIAVFCRPDVAQAITLTPDEKVFGASGGIVPEPVTFIFVGFDVSAEASTGEVEPRIENERNLQYRDEDLRSGLSWIKNDAIDPGKRRIITLVVVVPG